MKNIQLDLAPINTIEEQSLKNPILIQSIDKNKQLIYR